MVECLLIARNDPAGIGNGESAAIITNAVDEQMKRGIFLSDGLKHANLNHVAIGCRIELWRRGVHFDCKLDRPNSNHRDLDIFL